ncbi:MAG: sodium ABC transporter ATP-binding protein [Planctomycetota bacterium]|nr:MAG: sodium ABC transporter ATP-binding protein [Planctomycetota bacterium]
MIEVRELSKIYRAGRGRRVVALERVSFTCRPGEVYGLLGPNGAGKTTALRVLATALAPSAGTAAIDGLDIAREPDAVRRRLGFLSATTGLYGRLTAREMVQYFGRLYGMSRAEVARRTAELFAALGMSGFADRRCDALSTGMKQKVGIARTLVHDPPVLILDEPTAGLDVLTARAIVELVRRCRAEGKCVLFSTHDMAEAQKLCDRIGILHRGRLWAEGTVAEILARAGTSELEEAFLRLTGAASEPAGEAGGTAAEAVAS